MPKRGRRRKKTRTHASSTEQAQALTGSSALVSHQEEKVPKSLVLRRGKTNSAYVGELVSDLRLVMLPYTALHFEEDAKNRKLTLSQYAQHLCLPMGVTHLLAFSQTQQRLNLRLARMPEGPTLSFRVVRFSLHRHVKAMQRRPVSYTPSLQSNPPIVVTHNFGNADAAATSGGGGGGGGNNAAVPPHIKLLRITFQNMFPAINVSTVQLKDCRRVVLFNLVEEDVDGDDDDDDDDVEGGGNEDKDGNDEKKDKSDKKLPRPRRQIVQIRHYAITAKPVGVNRRVRRIVQMNRKLPNLHRCQDIADYLQQNAIGGDGGGGMMSDSEAEDTDDEQQQVVLPQQFAGRGNAASQKSALKLVELGPRLDLHLTKVEKGFGGSGDNNGGDVLYHAHVTKTPEEVAKLRQRKLDKASLKQHRQAQQNANVERKRQAEEEKRAAKRQRQKEVEEQQQQKQQQHAAANEQESDDENARSSSDSEGDTNAESDSGQDEE